MTRTTPLARIAGLFMALIVMFLTFAQPAAPAAAQSDSRYFPETGHSIAGPIRAYWERNGGLPVFGYPLTEQRQETVEGRTIQVQWFERDRLEIQADGRITAGRLGAQRLEQIGGYAGRTTDSIPQVAAWPTRTFPETGFSIHGDFRRYWERNGGLERFGYPISPVFQQTIGDWTGPVQYFERRRMEYHRELSPNTPNVEFVLLGLLGAEIQSAQAQPAPAQPTAPAPTTPALSCRVIHDYQLAGLPEVATSGSHIHVEYWDNGQPERETYLPAREAAGGRFIIDRQFTGGHVWEYADCSDEQVRAQIDGQIQRRIAGGANNAGYVPWRDVGRFRPAVAP